MNIADATADYEAWLATQITPVPADLRCKHDDMAAGPFPFLRATFYRWAQIWPHECAGLMAAPAVLAVGDLHVENFGTWRDDDGRLIWGVNDFDEACPLPYTSDLVRLAVSAGLAAKANQLAIGLREACDALLGGYKDGLARGGEAFVLEERHTRLRQMAWGDERNPRTFWRKIECLPTVEEAIPAGASAALEQLLPEPGLPYRVVHCVAGEGSLGRQRYLALADWRGGLLAREAKAMLPSAWLWAHPGAGPPSSHVDELLGRAVRCPDPLLKVSGGWIVRRLGPHCSRIELSSLPREREEAHLLEAMGRETANVHLGSGAAIAAVRDDLKHRAPDWLHTAAKAMAVAMVANWKAWRNTFDG